MRFGYSAAATKARMTRQSPAPSRGCASARSENPRSTSASENWPRRLAISARGSKARPRSAQNRRCFDWPRSRENSSKHWARSAWSDRPHCAASRRARFVASTRSCISRPPRQGERTESPAATESAASRVDAPRAEPRTRSLPRRAAQGRQERCLPSGVKTPPRTAASCSSASIAAVRASGRGASSRLAANGATGRAMARICITRPSRETRWTSGVVCSASLSKKLLRTKRQHSPRRTRPARPARCLAASRAIHCSVRQGTPRAASKPVSFARQRSTTAVTSAMVMDVSATFVATTTLTNPCGAFSNAFCWSLAERPPWSGTGRKRSCFSKSEQILEISYAPGQKTRTAPPTATSFSARAKTHFATSTKSTRGSWPGNKSSCFLRWCFGASPSP
mmetsp:Transcript_26965/g.90653  ORF Transcript_26965/g.90653 Transcript_26965/m.90653 type:complete len:394 (+) Transcript_26965:575-1756(+)